MKFANGSVSPQIAVSALQPNTWHHIVLTASGSLQKAYVDGVFAGSFTNGMVNHGSMDISAIGYIYTATNAGWAGWPANAQAINYRGVMDDVRIYKKMLSADEARALYEE